MNRFTIPIAMVVLLSYLSGAHAGPLFGPDRAFMIAQAADEQVDNNGRGESYWREKADDLRRQLDEQQAKLDDVNVQEQLCRDQQQQSSYRGSQPDCAAMYRNQKLTVENRITQIRNRLEVDLADEARKAGAYPGWLR